MLVRERAREPFQHPGLPQNIAPEPSPEMAQFSRVKAAVRAKSHDRGFALGRYLIEKQGIADAQDFT
jgi:hypothetical protein